MPLRAKKENLHVHRVGRNSYQNKLACHTQSVKENTSSFLLKGTLLLIFALYPCNPIFQLLNLVDKSTTHANTQIQSRSSYANYT
jgi:hypothetical protein